MRRLLLILGLMIASAYLGAPVKAKAEEAFAPIVVSIPEGANHLVCQPVTLGQGAE